jgi:hypothetical protein
MKEGTVHPPPFFAPALRTMMTEYLFRSYRMRGEHKAMGMKPLLERWLL